MRVPKKHLFVAGIGVYFTRYNTMRTLRAKTADKVPEAPTILMYCVRALGKGFAALDKAFLMPSINPAASINPACSDTSRHIIYKLEHLRNIAYNTADLNEEIGPSIYSI